MDQPPDTVVREDAQLGELMAAYQSGQVDAFDRLYAALEDELRCFFHNRSREADRVEDLVQETFLQIHRSRRGYLPGRPVRPWVYAIARHVLLMHVRTFHRREAPEMTRLSEIAEPGSRGDTDRISDRAELASALGRVPVANRRTFLLHHWRGLSFREIADLLHIRPGAAKLRSSRAGRQLRTLLREEPRDQD